MSDCVEFRMTGPLPALLHRVYGGTARRAAGILGLREPPAEDEQRLVSRPSLTGNTAIRVAEVVTKPFYLLVQVLVVIAVMPIVAAAAATWGLVLVARALIRPLLYGLGVAVTLATGAAGGYVYCAYQTYNMHQARMANPDDQGPAPPQTKIQPPSSAQGDRSPPFGPTLPRPEADPFGLRSGVH